MIVQLFVEEKTLFMYELKLTYENIFFSNNSTKQIIHISHDPYEKIITKCFYSSSRTMPYAKLAR